MAFDTKYEPKPNTGSLFKNNYKKAGDKQPELRGDMFLDKTLLNDLINNSNGSLIKLSVAVWSKESEKVGKFFTMNISEPYVKPEEDLPY